MRFVLNYLCNLFSVYTGKQPLKPLMFSYYVTHRCNLNCVYCCDGDGKRFKEEKIDELPLDQAKRLLQVLRKASDTIDITGGEPLLREDLEEILAFAKKLGFRIILNTKGLGLMERTGILQAIDVLVLSLDTLKAGELASLIGRNEETAEAIFKTLEFAIENRRKYGYTLVLSAVATPANLPSVNEVLQFALERGIGFHLSPEIVGTAVNPELFSNPDYQHLVSRVLECKDKANGVLGVREYIERLADFGKFSCHPLLMPTIRPDGRMYYPCLESKQAQADLLDLEDYAVTLAEVRKRCGEIPHCRDCCHIFCHMALSLFQRNPVSAIRELKHWRYIHEQ